MRVGNLAQRAGGQSQNGRAQIFSAAIEGILGVGNDLGVKITDLPTQLS